MSILNKAQNLFKKKLKVENQSALSYSKVEVDDDAIIITDTHKLLYLREDLKSLGLKRKSSFLYDFEKSKRIKEPNLTYPSYETVLDFPELFIPNFDYSFILNTIEAWAKQEKKKPKPIVDLADMPVYEFIIELPASKDFKTKRTPPMPIYFNAWLLYNAFKVLNYMGVDDVSICLTKNPTRPLMLLLPNKKGFMLLCPIAIQGQEVYHKLFKQVIQAKEKKTKRLLTYKPVYERGLLKSRDWLSENDYKNQRKKLKEYFKDL